MLKKCLLTMSILCAINNVNLANASDISTENKNVDVINEEDLADYDLDTVIVEGEKSNVDVYGNKLLPGDFLLSQDRVGVLGNIDAIDVPFTQKTYSEKAIETFYDPNQPLNGILANNPSIRIGSPSPMYTDFSMRGVNMNAAHYYINGIPNMFNQTRSIPAYVLESVDIVSGPNTVLNGATFSNNGTNGTEAPAGLLNGKTKRAIKDNINYKQSFSGKSTWTEHLDVGDRFGENDEWGIRVNAHREKGELSINDSDIDDKSIYVNIDHQDEKSTTNIFGGYYDWKIEGGQRWLMASSITKMPNAIDGKSNLSFDEQVKQNHGMIFTLNHTQKLSDKMSAFFNAGYGHYSESKLDPNSGSLTLKDNGILSGKFRDYVSDSKSSYYQIGLSNTSKIGDIKNDLTFAVDYFNYKSKAINSGSKSGQATIEGDLWNGVHINGNPIFSTSLDDVGYSTEQAHAMTLADRLEWGKSTLYTALQYKDTEVESSTGHKYSKDNLNPTVAFAYKPIDNLSIYTSYAESYTKPVEVSNSYINAGEIFEPIKNKQKEIGFKYENANILHSLAFFDLNQASYIVEDTGELLDRYTQEGENRFKGIEYSITGKFGDKWNLMGGLMYLDGKRENLASGKENLEGKFTTGTPKWNAVLAAEYEADENNSMVTRLNYMGSSYVNDNGVKSPSYTTLDLGYKYKTNINNMPVTINAMCYNVFDKNYWISRGTSLALGVPRTFMLSAEFDI